MPSRAALGWAFLFSVPPGVGVTGCASMVMGGGLIEPRAIAAGALVWAVVFVLVLGSQSTGEAEPKTVRERVD